MKNGFTLVEILITMTIISIIALLLIPVFIEDFQKQRFLPGFQKSYSVLNRALYEYSSIQREESDPDVLTTNGLVTVLEYYLATKKNENASGESYENCSIVPEKWIYTTDGFRYGVAAGGKILADVNGKKAPNRCLLAHVENEKPVIDVQGDMFEFVINEITDENDSSHKEEYLLPGNDTGKYLIFGTN